MGSIATQDLKLDYVPSPEAWRFHHSLARYRFLIWGIKAGKSQAGAVECVRHALSSPGGRTWVVGPTTHHTEVAWSEVMNILNKWEGVMTSFRMWPKPSMRLVNGSLIEFRSGERPDNLRGPNVDRVWIDEGSWLKPEAWYQCRERIAARNGEIWVTTTPKGRMWIWPELIRAGMPAAAPYGTWESVEESRFVSHFPTKKFGWVTKEYLADEKKTLPRHVFEREYLAKFGSEDSAVFSHIEDAMHFEEPPDEIKGSTVIGTDLAKHMDFTAIVVMDATGKAICLDHWNKMPWSLTKTRIINLAKKWNGVLCMDTSNVGSVIEDDLRAEGLNIFSVNMHDSIKKEELINSLQMAFENKQIRIPDYRAAWSGRNEQLLFDELTSYTQDLTRGGRITYSAPLGLHDDFVIALALANFGRAKGQAGGADFTTQVFGSRAEMRGPKIRNPAKATRRKMFKSIYGRRKSIVGLGSPDGPFWSR